MWDALRIVGRRWYVAAPIFVVFFALAIITSGQVDAEYEAQASLVLLAPNQAPVDSENPEPSVGYNPWLAACSTCEQVSQSLSLTLQSNAEKRAMEEAGWSPNYVIEPQTRSALVNLYASSRDSDNAVGTVDALIDRVASELETIQADANAPEDQRITVDILAQDETAAGDYASAGRVRLVLLTAGIVAACVAAFAAEAGAYYLERRRERRDAAPVNGDHPGPGYSDDPTVPIPTVDAPASPAYRGAYRVPASRAAWQQEFDSSGVQPAARSSGPRGADGQE